MKYLQEIIQLSASLRQEKVDFFSWNKRKEPKTQFEKLYVGILNGSIVNDKTACQILYGSTKKDKSTTYNSLKSRLFWRLTNSLFFIDQDRVLLNKFNKQLYIIRKNSTIVRILDVRGALTAAAYVAKKNLNTAIQYGFAEDICIFTATLMRATSSIGDEKGFEKYAAINAHWTEAIQYINTANIYFLRINSWYAAQWDLQQENLIEISNYIQTINSYRKKCNVNFLHTTYYHLRRVYAEIEQNYADITMVCDEALEYFKNNPLFSTNQSRAGFILPAFSANIWKGDYEAAYTLAQECTKLLRAGSQNWFYFQEPHFILALRSKNYQLAKQIFIEVTTHPNFNFKNEVMIEKWRLHEFYARFISQEDFKQTLLPKGIRGKHKHFRAFASTLPTLSKDLTGHNVVAVFAHILYLIRIGDFDTLIQRDESLQVLRRKRLTKLNYRLGIFARMIHIMVEHNFNPVPTQKFAKKWQNKLKHMPEKFKGGTAETLEIIPFEDLWEMMMNELKAVKHNSK